MTIVDAHSFWVVGYFEETKLRHIRVGDSAHVALMGYDPVLSGHVESIGHGISDNNDETGGLSLPDVGHLQLGAAGAARAGAHSYRHLTERG